MATEERENREQHRQQVRQEIRQRRHERVEQRRQERLERLAAEHDTRPKKAERMAARKEEFLDAAVRVIRREGPKTSMDSIAAEVGVTKPILYRYFGDRDGLAEAIGGRFCGQLMDELRAALAKGGPPRDLLAGTIDAYVRFVERDPEVYRFLVAVASKGPGGETLEGIIRQIGSEVAVVLGEQLRAVGADSGAAEPWAYGLVGMVHLAGDWWIDRRSMPRKRLVEYLTQLVWNGLAEVIQGAAQ